MLLAPQPPSINDMSIIHGQKIEFVIQDETYKSNFWRKVAPVNTIINNHKIDFYQVKELVSEFFLELNDKNHIFSNVSPLELLNYFIKGSKKLLSFNPSKISVELTSAKSIFFFATISSNNIYFELFFDEMTGKYVTTSVNIYENKSQILAISGSFEKVSSEIEEHITNNQSDIYSNFFLVSNEVSGSTLTQAEFQTY